MLKLREKIIFLIPIILLIANIFVWGVVARESRGGILTVAFLDVGQGDAIYIEGPNGNQILIDGGAGRQILPALGEVMPFYDRSLDMVIATHPDADHIGGLPFVLERFFVGAILESEVESTSAIYQELKRVIANGQYQHLLARRGMVVHLGQGVDLEIIFPDRNTDGWETNTASVVAKLVYGKTSFLLTGDSPIKIEQYLLSLAGAGLVSTVLKVGHHGSRTSTAPEYVAAVAPRYAVISAGFKNRYGHPHQEVLDILINLGAEILRTDQQGTIHFQTDGQSISYTLGGK